MKEIKDLSDPVLKRMKYVLPKLDGNFLTLMKDPCGVVTAWTRQREDYTEKIRHCEFYRILQIYFKGPCSISGELWKKNCPCSSLPTAIKNKEEMDFFAFKVRGIDTFEEAIEYCEERNLKHVPTAIGMTTKLQYKEYYDRMSQIFSPADGLVFADGPGENLIKWKPESSIDLILTGVQRGRPGKYYRTAGNLICKTAEGYEVAKCSGMTDIERNWIWDNWEKCKLKVIEVKYNGVGEKGRLRHPRFCRFREDKLPEECTVDQDSELAEKWRCQD